MAGGTCTVCSHPNREAIDQLLVNASLSRRGIARQFGLDNAAVDRHKANHLQKRVVEAVEKIQEKQGDAFMEGILAGMTAAKRGVEHGMAQSAVVPPELAYRLAPGFLAQQARYLELLGQATGRLNQHQAGVSSLNLVVVMPRELPAGSVQALPQTIDIPVLPPTTDDES